jgi:metal-sulfur cluster biosynthetic enzyme
MAHHRVITETLADRVLAAVRTIEDPCSIATRHPVDIVDLGLLVDLGIEDGGDVRVTLRPTSGSCTLIGSIMQAVQEQVSAVDGVHDVNVELDLHSMWTPDEMTESGKQRLAAARAKRIAELRALGVRPYAEMQA